MATDELREHFRERFSAICLAIERNGYSRNRARYPLWLLDIIPQHSLKTQLERLFFMASKKRKALSKNFSNMEFVNYKFDAETKASFETWYETKSRPFVDAIFETLQAECKLSLSWDDEKECVIAAMTGKEDSLNPGKCLTLRSADWIKAIAACAYVHTIVFSGEIWEVDTSTDML